MKKLSRIWAIATLGCIIGGLIAACQPAQSPTVATEQMESQDTESDASEEEVTITFWHIYGQEFAVANDWFNNTISDFEKEYPNINVEVETFASDPFKDKLKTAIQAGEAADALYVLAGGVTEVYCRDGALLPMNKYLDQEGWRDTFSQAALEAVTWDGKECVIPIAIRTVHIYYNKKVFEEYNLKPATTLEELKEIIVTLQENGVTPFALGNQQRWQGNFWHLLLLDRFGGYQTWENAVQRRGGQCWNHPANINALDTIQELVDMGAFTEGANGIDSMDVNNSFITGEAGMFLIASFYISQLQSIAPEGWVEENLGYFNFPIVEGGDGSVNDFEGGLGPTFAVNAKTEHPDEVALFYRFMTRPENVKVIAENANWVPVIKGAMPEKGLPILTKTANDVQNMENLISYADYTLVPEMYEKYADITQSTFGLDIAPEEAASNMEKIATEVYGECGN